MITFDDFLVTLKGHAPFAWQRRAATELRERGWWSALSAPTGAGKTSLIEAWLHALSFTGPDTLGRRLFWVIDRRSVVDQVHSHATSAIDGLRDRCPEILERLTEIGGGRPPLAIVWRGALDDAAREQARAVLDPARVAVICTTVDQVGSRLLFRGYGLSAGSRAAHAGLIGVDSTLVLDEAHLSQPLIETARTVARLQRECASPRPPLRVLPVTATPREDGGFRLSEDERREPAIARRLTARKRLRLETARDVAAVVDLLLGLGRELTGGAVGVVMNTVRGARAVFEALGGAGVLRKDRALLIGPVRPLDRRDPLSMVPRRAERGLRERPFYVVATQTIEVGVDLDLDALVTECAPMSSIIQRAGRLDREGQLGDSVIVVLEPPRRGCPVYGDATGRTWQWLRALAQGAEEVDLGPEGIERLRSDVGWPVEADPPRVPLLLRHHVEAFARTSGQTDESPDVDLYLHGDRDATPDVTLIWRADVARGADVSELMSLRPPHSEEGVAVSLPTARRWIEGRPALEGADVTGVPAEPDVPGDRSRPRPAWIVERIGHGRHRATPLGEDGGGGSARGLRPGDVVVVPADEGGLDEFGWAPDCADPVTDLGSLSQRRPAVVLRGAEAQDAIELSLIGDLTLSEVHQRLIDAAIQELPAEPRYAERMEWAREALAEGTAEIVLDDSAVLFVPRTRGAPRRAGGDTLAAHQEAVAARVDAIVTALALDDVLADDLSLAARHHDEGKRDPRFQGWLAGGRPQPEPLAKSSYVATRSRVERLREASGWPERKRHELLSAVLLRRAHPDRTLPAWLAMTHHGHNRPFPRAVSDPQGADILIDVEIDGRALSVSADALPDPAWTFDAMEQLTAAHGPWGLALLEAIIIGADRETSGDGPNGNA